MSNVIQFPSARLRDELTCLEEHEACIARIRAERPEDPYFRNPGNVFDVMQEVIDHRRALALAGDWAALDRLRGKAEGQG